MIDFEQAPEIGTMLWLDDQPYELVAVEPHRRVDGTMTTLLHWETACPKCGEGFRVLTGLKAKSVNRRCKDCAKAGKPVKGKRSRKVRVRIDRP